MLEGGPAKEAHPMTRHALYSARSPHPPRTPRPPRTPHSDRGFTLIELIVVILVLGILTAIAVPVFMSQQASAQDSAATSDLVNYRKAMITYSVENDGAYTNNVASLTDHGAVQSTQAAPFIIVSGSRFCVQLTSDSSTRFYITDRVSVQNGTCATSGDPAFTPQTGTRPRGR